MSFNLRTASLSCVLALGGLLAACSSTTSLEEAPVETRTPVAGAGASAPGSGTGATASGTSQTGVKTVDLSKQADADAASLANRVVYFDYDSFDVKDEYRPMLETHAKALRAERSKRMVLEGHTDERGGSEYNLALGQKRAEAVLKTLVLMGVAEGQLEAVSFGKERPVATAGDEAAMAKNRRVELKAK
jgi:peptidoglycan-associated lipoprotein